MSRRAGLALRLGATLALLALVLWWVDARRVLGLLAQASPAWVGIVVLLHTGDRLLMAFKWWQLLRARDLPLRFGDAVRAYYVSSFAGVFLPMTVGADLVRVAALRGSGLGNRALVASIAVERGLGAVSQALFCLLSVGVIVALQLDVQVSVAGVAAAAAAMLAVLALSLPLSFGVAGRLAGRFAEHAGLAGKLGRLAGEYADWRRYPAAMGRFLLLTFLEGFFPIVTYVAAASAVGADAGLVEMTALVPVVYLVARLPVSVAGIGVEQGGFVLAAGALLGLPAAAAAAVSFLVSPLALLVALLPGATAYVFSPPRLSDGGSYPSTGPSR